MNLITIFKEIREFRQDTGQQLKGIKEEINSVNKRVEEAEERIEMAETRIQTSEDVLAELVKLQVQTEAKLTELEGRTRRENIRIHGVREGAEADSASIIVFMEELLSKGLDLPPSTEMNIERAHRALASKPPDDAPPRSIVVKFASYRVKEKVLKTAWQKRGFEFEGKRIHLDHDYAPDIMKKRREYAEAKKVLKERNIRFQTPFPARLRVFYKEGPELYNSAVEATAAMAERGIPVTVLRRPPTLLERINQQTWQRSGRKGNLSSGDPKRDFKEKLRAFRRQDN